MTEEARVTIEVPGYEGRAVEVATGERIRITDIEGEQIGDLFALSQADHTEFLSTAVTRMINASLFPEVGGVFHSSSHRPVLTFLADNSPGPHDTLMAPCDRELYAARGQHDHPNCRENYLAAAETAGLSHAIVPDPVNVFQNSPARDDGTIDVRGTLSKPGDHIELRAEMDIILILTACSSERINGGKSTALRIEVFAG